MIPLVDLKAQYNRIKPEIDAAIATVIENTRFIGGKELTEFETAFAAYQSTDYAIGCASGTGGIFLVLRSLRIQPGDEIITTPHTFIATVEPIEEIGAVPVLLILVRKPILLTHPRSRQPLLPVPVPLCRCTSMVRWRKWILLLKSLESIISMSSKMQHRHTGQSIKEKKQVSGGMLPSSAFTRVRI